MAADQGVKVDEAKFRELMAEQKSRARADALKKRHNVDLSVYDDFKKTLLQPIDFLGYTDMSARAKVLGIMQEGKGSVPAVTGPANIEVILDRTPFYAQAGGQLADQGEILSDDGAVLEVDDVQKPIKDPIVHQCRLTEGTLVVGAEVNANIDLERRGAIARSHTATHMVHKALREELGPQATQRGSEDAPNRLRFDFQWSSAPSKDAMNAVEARVNEKLRENLAVTTQEMKFDDAIALGAMHLFGVVSTATSCVWCPSARTAGAASSAVAPISTTSARSAPSTSCPRRLSVPACAAWTRSSARARMSSTPASTRWFPSFPTWSTPVPTNSPSV